MSDQDKKRSPQQERDEQQRKPSAAAAAPAAAEPSFRFAEMRTGDFDPTLDTTRSAKVMAPMVPMAMQMPSAASSSGSKRAGRKFSAMIPAADTILKEDYFKKDEDTIRIEDYPPNPKPAPVPPAAKEPKTSNWAPSHLRPVPAFYPLEKSTRLVEDQAAPEVAERVSERLRTLSVYALYDNEAATASLLTAENVEMHLSLWQTPQHSVQQGVLVELQRRKGDSIAFHRYSRSILDAAMGDHVERAHADGYAQGATDDIVYSRKVQRLMSMELGNRTLQEHENAIIAIEIAHGLLMKDRMDARQLGLESLCLLTDPSKTGEITSTLAAHVVLLGSTHGVQIPGVTPEGGESTTGTADLMQNEGPFQEIRETILGLVQFSRIGEDSFGDDDEDELMQDPMVAMAPPSIDKEQMTLLHNLALAVLANALDAIENTERYEEEPEDTKPRARLRTASSTDVAEEFMTRAGERSDKEILSTLISELGKAQHKPHNATLSAKCIGSLCRASERAKRRAKELGAKQVVATALDVGERTHLKLETECKKVSTALETPRAGVEEQGEEENE